MTLKALKEMLSRAGEAAGNPNWQAKTIFNSHSSPACLTACFSDQFFEASIHIVTLPLKIAQKVKMTPAKTFSGIKNIEGDNISGSQVSRKTNLAS